jgi:lipid II isoglutaminyl synthase (glutamine-hydrolysing)
LVETNFKDQKVQISILINDKIADGKDVSWLWDCQLEELIKSNPKFEYSTSGSRGLDILLRLDHAKANVSLDNCFENIETLLEKKIYNFNAEKEKHIILATYTSMLKIRKLISERTKLANISDKGN